MKHISKLATLLSISALVACNVNQDNNKSLDYDTLDVHFSGKITGGAWNTSDVVGIMATCTRGDETDVIMNSGKISTFTPATATENATLSAKTEEDKIFTNKGDHNFKVYAFTPYSGGEVDLTAIPADIPATVNYGSEVSQLYVASRIATSVIAPIALDFSTPSCLVKLSIPDDIINEDGGTILKSMVLKPVNEENFTGSLAYSATYNLYSDNISVTEGSGTKEIKVDFGAEGHQMVAGYTPVTFLMAPFTVPEGGFQLTFTAADGKTNMIPFLNNKEGEVYAAGSLIEQTMSSSGDGVIPCNSPVEWWIGGGGNHGWQDYPHISTSKQLGVFNYDTQPFWRPTAGGYGTYDSEHIWTANQPQATIEFKVSDSHPNTSVIVIESNNFPEYGYSSPCVKGLWTGDYFEFSVPVKKFAANTTVTVSFPAMARKAQIFWNIEYLDGEEWKKHDMKTRKSPDEQFEKECSVVIPHGYTRGAWEGVNVTTSIVFENEIKSGYLKIRFSVADGQYVTKNDKPSTSTAHECTTITAPDKNGLFAFVNKSGDIGASVKVEW